MNKTNQKITIALLAVVISVFISSSAWAVDYGNIYVVQIKGTAVGEMREVPDIDGDGKPDKANCFDVDLIDPTTNLVIGTATDCLSKVTPVGDGLALIGTTYFNFKEGTLVVRGKTSVQPKTHGSEPSTHITGGIPSPGANNVLYGTGIFEGATGSVRLSGAVNMSKFKDKGEISFDCIFIITLD